MRIDSFHQSINAVLESCQKMTLDLRPARIFPVLDLARSWLCLEDGPWIAQHKGWILDAETPERRARRGIPAFDTGFFIYNKTQNTTTIGGRPEFFSPASTRQEFGVATVLPAFGPLGGHRYSMLHEIGHYLENEMGMIDRSPAGALASECRADGFAVALAVAQGADPQQVVRQTQVWRACTMVEGFSSDYYTIPFLPHAAAIGLDARERRLSPVHIMDQLDKQIGRVRDWQDLAQAIDAEPMDVLVRNPNPSIKTHIVAPMQEMLHEQASWTTAQDQQWWARLLAANPKEAPVLKRMDTALLLDAMTQPNMIEAWKTQPAPRASTIINRLKRLVEPGSADFHRLDQIQPKSNSPADHAAALEQAGRTLRSPLDTRIKAALTTVQFMMETSQKGIKAEPADRVFPGTRSAPAPMALIDVRSGLPGRTATEEITSHMRHARVTAIGVLASTRDYAEHYARFLRKESDCMAATIHPMDPERFCQRQSTIKDALRSGKVWLMGDAPELRTPALDQAR